MDKRMETLHNVLLGTVMTATAGATIGATVAVLKNAPVRQYTLATGINCGVFGATFFVIRESFLSYQQSKNPRFGLKDSITRDTDNLVSSTLAGATTGGLLSAVYRGPRGVVPGTVMFGLICAGAQTVYTAANRWRQEKILQADLQPATVKPEPVVEKKGLFESFRLPSWVPIRMLSDDEYNEILDAKLKQLELEMMEIERELKNKEKKA